jgi:hypothetical protein
MYVSCKHLSTSLSLIIPAAAQPGGQAVINAWRLGTDCRYVYPAHTKVAQDLHRPMGYTKTPFPLPHSTHRSIILPSICTQACLEHFPCINTSTHCISGSAIQPHLPLPRPITPAGSRASPSACSPHFHTNNNSNITLRAFCLHIWAAVAAAAARIDVLRAGCSYCMFLCCLRLWRSLSL